MSPTIIIGMLGGLLIWAIGVVIKKLKTKEFDFDISYMIFHIVIGFIVGVAVWFIISPLIKNPTHEIQKEKRTIVSLRDGSGGTSGSFFLGIGSFNSSMKYYGYEDLGGNRFKMVRFSTIDNIIVEDIKDGESSYFVEIVSVYTGSEWDKWYAGPNMEREYTERYEIHIPRGSILKNEYKLDLE